MLFGRGLLGSAIREALLARRFFELLDAPIPWLDESELLTTLAAIQTAVGQARVGSLSGRRVNVVWAAGKSGFNATSEETAPELATFRFIIGKLLDFLVDKQGMSVGFYLLSSAGGLYEGQTLVTDKQRLSIKRPYGELKKQLEDHVLGDERISARRIYRLSSVYGNISSGHRAGLIATLIANGVNRKPSFLFGHMQTLRDYIYTEDIAQHVADDAESMATNSEVEVLASGKPSSIFEIKGKIEDALNHKLYLSFRPGDNTLNITFQRSLIPDRLRIQNLEQNIRKIYRTYRFETS